MVGDFNFKLRGVDALERELKSLGVELAERAGNNSLRAGGRIFQRAVQGNIEQAGLVLSGRAVEEVKLTTDRDPDPGTRRVFLHNGAAFWMMFHEFGTSTLPATPTFTPAIEENFDAWLNKVAEGLAANLKRFAKADSRPR